ncbi:MAG: hypothetical protein JWN76_2655 [Chitinophagaceae bacterium]|nr:hypothetical protein [Chitinophagaceae bacterium]
MFKRLLILTAFTITALLANAQYLESYVQEGEFGFSLGAAHYYGDLNTSSKFNRPKVSAGIFFRKQFSNYIGARLSVNYAQLGYSDKYSTNPTEQIRNLSFNTNVWEMSLTGEFNFFQFIPGQEGFRYTPYVFLGAGAFSYDPYAYLGGEKYYLRQIGTEGQGSNLYPNRTPYSSISMCIPVGAGIKYSLSGGVNVFGEIGYRFTNTDYLDDVSTSYAPDAFPPLPNGQVSTEYLLQDRSYEFGTPIGVKGRQRGNSKQKDSYVIIQVGISLNLSSYRCPTQ